MDNLVYRGGTPWSEAHDPEGNIETIDTAITAGTAATANIAVNVTAISNLTDGTTPRTGVITNTTNAGTAAANVTAVEAGDGSHHITTLTLTAVPYTIAAAANECVGALIYTLPAGAQLLPASYMSVALQGGGVVDADTPEVGVGSVIGTGAQATIGAAGATMEDYLVGTAAADCSGTATVVGPVGATAGAMTGIALNATADVKTLHLNLAANWAGADTVTATGTVVIVWDTLA